MAGGFARSLERPQTIARFALNIIKNELDKQYYQTYLTRLEAVNKETVLTMAQKYFTAKNCNIVVVGNDQIIERLKQFDADGKIEFLDAYGNEVKDLKKADITKEQLIEKYILTVTKTTSLKSAAKKLKKIKSVEEQTELSMAQIPFPLKSTRLWISPNMEGQKLEGQGMTFQKSYFDGKTGVSTNMQTGSKNYTEDEINSKKKMTGLFPEMNYASEGLNTELIGIENQNGSDVYVLKVVNGATETFDYYDTKTFLKLKTISIQKEGEEVQETTSNYSDYKEVDGILFPHAVTIAMGEVVFSGKITSILVNGSGDLKSFK
jgi:hypothetical protein